MKGRRLKRYLGLKRESLSPGYIEVISPSKVLGWIAGKNTNFVEVRLVVGKDLIASSSIDKPRPDVCEAYGFVGNPGFEILFPNKIPLLNWSNKPKLIAISADGKNSQDLFLINDKANTSEVLSKFLKSTVTGMTGNVDGIQSDGLIHGWAGRAGEENPADIWIRCERFNPIRVKCDYPRENLEAVGIENNIFCGFQVKLADLPLDWCNKEVKFSFDEEGYFLIPQQEKIITPKVESLPTYDDEKSKNEIINVDSLENIKKDNEIFKNGINEYLHELEKFSKSLDLLESEIYRSNSFSKKLKLKKNNWLFNLFKN